MAEMGARKTKSPAPIQETWGNREFIERWVAKGGWQSPIREIQMGVAMKMIPQKADSPIRILDLAAGYGAMAIELLKDRPGASALCLDASDEMIKMGRERCADLGERIEFVQGSLETADWLNCVTGTFAAVVSARALHHFTANQRRRFLFREIFGILRAGGCFINVDNVRASTQSLGSRYKRMRDSWLEEYFRSASSGKQTLDDVRAATPNAYHGPHHNGLLEEELAWLREAGFEDVDCFWKFGTMTVYGGFHP